MRNQSRGIGLVQFVWVIAGIMVAVAAGIYVLHTVRNPSVQFTTPYQAVLLTNGSVYFGHLWNYGGPNPFLTDVFYVLSQTDPATKEVRNSLIKRGKELHEPDHMYLTPNQIVFVETVGTNSKVAQLIAHAPQ